MYLQELQQFKNKSLSDTWGKNREENNIVNNRVGLHY